MAQIDSTAEISPRLLGEQKDEVPDGILSSRNIQPSKQRLSHSSSPYTRSSALPSPPLHQREISVPHFTSIQDLVEKYKQPAFQQEALQKAKEVVRNFSDYPHKSEEMVWGIFPLIFLKDHDITRGLVSALLETIRDKPLGEPAYYEVLTQIIACDLVQEVLAPQDLVEGLKILVKKLEALHVQPEQKELPQLSAVLSVIEVMAEMGVSRISKEAIKNPAYQSVKHFASSIYSLRIRYLASCCTQALTAIKSDEKKGQMVRRKMAKALSATTRTGVLALRIVTGQQLLEMILSLADAGWGGAGDMSNIVDTLREVFHRKDSKKHWHEMALLFDEAFLKIRGHEEGWEKLLKQIKGKNWKKHDWKLLYNLVQNWRDVALNDPQASHREEALRMLDRMFRDKDQWGGKKEMREGVLHALMEINEQGQEQEAQQACDILKALRQEYLEKKSWMKRFTKTSQLVRKHTREEEKLEALRDQPRSASPDLTEADGLLQSLQQSIDTIDSSQRSEEAQHMVLQRLKSLQDLIHQTAQESKESSPDLETYLYELRQALTSPQVDQETLTQLQSLTEVMKAASLETGEMQAALRAQMEQWNQEVQTLREAHQAELQAQEKPSLDTTEEKRSEATVAATLQMSLQAVQKQNPHALELLRLCAYLAPEGIPALILEEWAKKEKISWQACSAVLKTYSLVEEDPETETFAMEPLVQKLVRQDMSRTREGKELEWLENTVLKAVLKKFNYSYEDMATLSLANLLAPHVKVFLAEAERVGVKRLKKLALAHSNLGLLLQDQSRYEGPDGAEFHLRKALEMRKKAYEGQPHHLDLAMSHNNLGNLLNDQGNYEGPDGAEFHLRKALEIKEEAYKDQPHHPDLALSHNNLGSLLYAQRNYAGPDGAEFHYRKALEIRKKAYEDNPHHPNLASSHSNLGIFLHAQGKYEEAEFHLRKRLEIDEKVYEGQPEHPNLAIIHNNLGSFLQDQSRYEGPAGAEFHYRKALEIREKAYEGQPHHPDLGVSHDNLGNLLLNQGRYEEAEKHLRKALEICEKAYEGQPEHPDLAAVYLNLGSLFYNQRKYEEAERYLRKALVIDEKRHADQPGGEDLATTYNNLGNLLSAQGKYEKAEEYLRKALEIREKAYAEVPYHPDLAASHSNLGGLLHVQRKYEGLDGAEFHLRKALEIREKAYAGQPEHPDLATSHNNLGKLYLAQAKQLEDQENKQEEEAQTKRAEAKEHLERALEIRKKQYGSETIHSHLAFDHDLLGRLFHSLEDQEQAQVHFQAAAKIVESYYQKKTSHPDIRAFYQQGLELEEKGEFKQAISQYQQALSRAEEIYGKESTDPHFIICHTSLSRVLRLQKQWALAATHIQKALAVLERRRQSIAPEAFPQVYTPHHTLHLFQSLFLHGQLGEVLEAQAQEAEQSGDVEEAPRLHGEAEQALATVRELDPAL